MSKKKSLDEKTGEQSEWDVVSAEERAGHLKIQILVKLNNN